MMNIRKLLLFLSLLVTTAATRAALTDFELLPSADKPIKSLATVKIVFPEAKFLGMYGSQLQGVTLTSVADPSLVYEPCNLQYSTFFSSNSETFSLRRKGETAPSVVDKPGKYLLHIPSGCIELCGDWYTHLGYNDEINVTYTVGDEQAGYDSYFDPATLIIRPVPGRVMEFRDVSIQFPVTEEFPTIDIIDTGLITMTREGEDAPAYVLADTSFDGEGMISFNFRRADSGYTLPEYIFEPGDYTVNIPAGVFRLTSTDIVNDNLSLRYTVTGTNAASAELKNYTLTPAPGTLESIPGITIEYPDLKEALAFPDGVTDITPYLTDRITLTRLNDDPYYCTVYDIYSATLRDNNKIDLLFKNRVSLTPEPRPETISRQGDYRLTVLPNTFKLKSNTFAFNARIEAYYTVSRDVPANRMERYVLDPADGEEVGRIDLMSITFPEASEGLVYPVDKTRITLTNTEDAQDTYQACALMLQGNKLTWGWNRPSHPYDDRLTIDREGTYLLRIEAATMADYENPTQSNPEIMAVIHVSADSEFAYTLTPAPGAYTELPAIGITTAGNARDLHATGEAGSPATLREAFGMEYVLEYNDGAFVIPQPLAEGTYTLTIPAGYFVQTNGNGKEVYNRVITAEYRIVRPSHFSATVIPPSGSELSGLSSISIIPSGAEMRGFGIDETAGTPALSGCGRDITLTPSLSQYSVAFLLPEGETLAPGEYTFTLPEGYITVTDGNGILTAMDAVTARYTIREGEAPQVSGGIFFLNEGVFGSEFGSLDYLAEDMATMHYDVLGEANAGRTPGVTAQYGCIFGNRLYIVSKQASYDDTASLLTVADATTLKIEKQTEISQGAGRAVCPIDASKAYIGTSDGVLLYDCAAEEIAGIVEGTATGAGKYCNQVGDMIRLGKYVFAAVQDTGVFVIDPAQDRLVSTLPVAQVSGLFVTGEGRLFASSDSEETPFVEIDSETLSTTAVAACAAPVSSSWGSWKSIPVTADIRGNRIFYLAGGNTSAVALYDFDTDTFKPNFITLPSVDGHRMQAYGTAVSTDPLSGYVVVTAIGDFGNTDRNAIFFANPSDGTVAEGMTIRPDHKYWFPAMSFYTPGDGPVLTPVSPLTLLEETDRELDCTGMTYLSVGNCSLIVYDAVSSDPDVCRLERKENGLYTLSAKKKGTATVTVTADYRGMTARTEVSVTVSDDLSVSSPEAGDAPRDVYDISGRLILRDATPEQIRALDPGLYIIGNRKQIVL